MNILAFGNGTGSVQWRLEGPANYINTRTDHSMFVTSSHNWHEEWQMGMKPDLVIGQMWNNPRGVEFLKRLGIPFILEADDMVLDNPLNRVKLQKLTKEQIKTQKETYKLASAITVTTEKLAEHYRHYNENVYILPNFVDLVWWGKPWPRRNIGPLRIGWMGSISHHEDLEFIHPILSEIVKDNHVKFVYCGYGGKKLIFGEDLFPTIEPHKKEYVSGVLTEYWPDKSRSLGFDIGIAPLVQDRFNDCKSPIKYFEYALNGVPAIYSDSPVYRDTVKHGETGLIARNEREWKHYLNLLLEDKELREMITEQAFNDVIAHYTLEDNLDLYLDTYQKVING